MLVIRELKEHAPLPNSKTAWMTSQTPISSETPPEIVVISAMNKHS
jgi:hypothetical protein